MISAGLESANGTDSFSAISALNGRTISAPRKIPVAAPIEPITEASAKISFLSVRLSAPITRKIEYSLLR